MLSFPQRDDSRRLAYTSGGVDTMAMDPNLKIIVVVGDNIDVNNNEEALWAIATRVLLYGGEHFSGTA